MKKIISMLLALTLIAVLFAGCGSNDNVLTVATSPDFAPMEFCDVSKTGQDQYVGFDIMLANYIADELDMELEILPMDFDGTITELGAGKADIGMAGYSPDPDRENVL